MPFARQNPKIPEGINTSEEHPLKEFLLLLIGVLLAVVGAVMLVALLAGHLAHYIPFRYEQRLVMLFTEPTALTEPEQRNPDFENAERALRSLGQRLAADAELPEDMQLQFHLVKADDLPNAFATLGGHIFVTTGLIRQIDSENALAMVIAHEIAHIRYRHPVRGMSSGLVIQFMLSLITGSQSTGLTTLVGQTGLLTLFSFSRSMETDADRAALDTLYRHYGTLDGADVFFAMMLDRRQRPAWQAMFETHPDTGRRLALIRQAIAERTGDTTPVRPLDPRLIFD